MRYVVTGDGLLIAGSEAGMVPIDEAGVVEKGALGPGQMIGVHMGRGELCRDEDLKNRNGAELRQRQIAAGYSIEDLETILAPMVEDAKEAIGSMGDDTPSAVLSEQYRPLSHFFRQNFSQVTNPPIDSLREDRVMSLKTRFGNLKNVLDEDNSH